MAALVPYKAGEVVFDAAMAREFYKDAKWAGRKIARGIGKAYRARKRQAKKRKYTLTQVGEPMKNIHLKKETTHQLDVTNIDTRTLYDEELTIIDGGDGEDERSRSLINCKGIEFCYHLYNRTNTPMLVNLAILAPKHTSSGISVIDFFRGTGGARGMDFGTTLSALQLHYSSINTDKYTVIKHMRMQMGPQGDAVGLYNSDTGPANFKTGKFWIKVNRQLRYDNSLSTSCNTPIYAVWWIDKASNAASASVETNLFAVSFMHNMYYTDVL